MNIFTIDFFENGQFLSTKINVDDDTNNQGILEKCKIPQIPLHLFNSIESCLIELSEMKQQEETDKLIDELLKNPISKHFEENLEFPRVFSLLFFSDFKNQQRLIKIEQQMNVVYRDLRNDPKEKLTILKSLQRREYQKFVRDLSLNSDLTQQIDIVPNSSYPKLGKCKTFEISFKIPGEIQNDVSRSTLEMFGIKSDEYKVNLILVLGSTCSKHLTSFDDDNDLNEISQRTRNIFQLYSNDLNALITPCTITEKMDIQWKQDDFDMILKDLSFPELHFESMEEQVEMIKREYLDSKIIPRNSEFFLTKHSNLAWIHTIFHMITQSGHDPKTDMKEMFVKCASFGVSNISIQLPLDPSHQDHNEKQFVLQQVTDVLSAINLSYGKCKIKSFKNIFLFLPTIDEVVNMERLLFGALGVENVTRTNLNKLFE